MKLKIVITALVLSLALPVAADFRTIAEAYEIALSDIRLPYQEAGTITFRKCAECPYQTKRVDATTVWEIDGKTMSLEKFRHIVLKLADPSAKTVQVLHHLERDRVTKVWILIG